MESSPQTFDAVCRSLIAAGESGGGFEQMLDRLATLPKQMQLRSAIVGALIYPTLLIIIAINVLCTMLLFVLPRFTGLFASLDVPLPPTTKFLMALSERSALLGRCSASRRPSSGCGTGSARRPASRPWTRSC